MAEPSQKECLVCGSRGMSVFWEMARLPIHCNVLCETRDEALAVPTGDICLSICGDCGFIYNLAFDPARLRYSQAYENSLHFSPRFQEYAESLAARLVEKHDLRNKDVIEIACGKGDFLRLLCRLGGNRGVGFDPSYVPQVEAEVGQERVTIVQEFYSERYVDHPADLICCRHALEHVADPVAFLRTVRRCADDRRDTVVFFEVPNVLYTLRDLGIWDIIYEHCSYFGPVALARCFTRSGFVVDTVSEEYEGQFLTIEARPGDAGDAEGRGNVGDPRQVLSEAAAFAVRFDEKVAAWKGQLEAARGSAGRVVVWGSGSKGVTFLNILQAEDVIEHVVDVNPRKQGMYVAGTGQQIVAPDFLREYRPDRVIVMNPIYEDEIRGMLGHMELKTEVLLA